MIKIVFNCFCVLFCVLSASYHLMWAFYPDIPTDFNIRFAGLIVSFAMVVLAFEHLNEIRNRK